MVAVWATLDFPQTNRLVNKKLVLDKIYYRGEVCRSRKDAVTAIRERYQLVWDSTVAITDLGNFCRLHGVLT